MMEKTIAFAINALPMAVSGAKAGLSVAKRGATTSSRSAVVCCATVSRRAALRGAALGAASLLLGGGDAVVLAADVEPYVDLPKGFRIMRPANWNEFSASPEQYDVKWQDVIQPLEFVTVLTTPASKPLSALGEADEVGKRLAASRGGELVQATAKDIDGIPAYVVEIKRGPAHQLTLLTVNKQKLYALTASSGENRWAKRERLLRQVVDSFQPKL